jgi:hypothetical protein
MATYDPNEDYTELCVKDTFQFIIHIGGSGECSGSLYDGVGNLININWLNLSQSICESINKCDEHPLNRELMYAGYLGS